jgi:hypothetical protein
VASAVTRPARCVSVAKPIGHGRAILISVIAVFEQVPVLSLVTTRSS